MQDAFFAAARTLTRFLCLRGTIDSGNDERATSASIQLQHLNEQTSVCVVGNPVNAERRHRLANASHSTLLF
jgi:hypothetical protein